MTANPRDVYDRLTKKHMLSPIIACAILGNIQQESNFKTTTEGFDGTGSTGLCQWLGARLAYLKKCALNYKTDWRDWETQVDFIKAELLTTEILAWRKLRIARTVEEATLAFSKYYERPSSKYAHNDKRVAYAKSFYSEFASE